MMEEIIFFILFKNGEYFGCGRNAKLQLGYIIRKMEIVSGKRSLKSLKIILLFIKFISLSIKHFSLLFLK